MRFRLYGDLVCHNYMDCKICNHFLTSLIYFEYEMKLYIFIYLYVCACMFIYITCQYNEYRNKQGLKRTLINKTSLYNIHILDKIIFFKYRTK